MLTGSLSRWGNLSHDAAPLSEDCLQWREGERESERERERGGEREMLAEQKLLSVMVCFHIKLSAVNAVQSSYNGKCTVAHVILNKSMPLSHAAPIWVLQSKIMKTIYNVCM